MSTKPHSMIMDGDYVVKYPCPKLTVRDTQGPPIEGRWSNNDKEASELKSLLGESISMPSASSEVVSKISKLTEEIKSEEIPVSQYADIIVPAPKATRSQGKTFSSLMESMKDVDETEIKEVAEDLLKPDNWLDDILSSLL